MVEYVVRATSISHGMIECEPMMVRKTSAVFIGVTETMEAALDRCSAKIYVPTKNVCTIQSLAPVAIIFI